jgi:DNA polymerase III epsilon subunit-like protein
MNYLFFDTETTGLPRNYKAHYTDTSNWPRIVQLAWLLADSNGTILKESDFIIKVDFPIPEEASRVHGITNAVAEAKGVIISEVLNSFLTDLNNSDKLICHNVSFDLTILQSELFRNQLTHKIETPTFCTMKKSTDFCQLPGPYGFKWPKLEELYNTCFGKKLTNAHNAMADVRATYEVFYHLKNEHVFEL